MKHNIKALLTSTVLVLAGPAMAADSGLLVFDYSGFEDPIYHGKYVEAHGDSPSFAFFGDEEEAFQKIRSGFKADVAHICAGSVTKWIESGIILPWDTSKITEYANLDRNLTGSAVGGGDQIFFIPTDWGSTAIAYNTKEVPAEDIASLDVFLNPKYAGRMSIADNVDDAFALAYLATGVTDWRSATDDQINAAAEWLRQAHQNLRTYWTDPAELSQLMATGEVLVSWAWNETYPTLRDEDFPIGYQRQAKEGSSVWMCGLVDAKDGEGEEAKKYDYVNAFLDPSTTAPLLESGYGHANAASMSTHTDEELTDVGLGKIDAPVLAQLPMPNEQRQKQSDLFEKIKAGF